MKQKGVNSRVKKLFVILLFICVGFFAVNISSEVLAQSMPGATDLASGGEGLAIPKEGVQISPTIPKASFGDILLAMVNYFLGFLGFLATLAFIYAGVLWVLSGGAEDSITKAKKIITYASLGLVVVILSYSAVQFIVGSPGRITDSLPKSGVGGCSTNDDCPTGQTCYYDNESEINKCTITTTGNACETNQDCPTGFVCNVTTLRCVSSSDSITRGPGSVQGEISTPASDDNLTKMDDALKGIESDLNITDLSDTAKENVINALKKGAGGNGMPGLTNKIDTLKKMLEDPLAYGLTDSDIRKIEAVIGALERLRILRYEMDDLRKIMPESKDLIQAYDEASDTLNELIDDPLDRVKFRRFDTKYKALKELIKKFPYVRSVIWVTPSSGNVPFTVQLDGLESFDPTGGTISDYKWTYIDSSGSEVLIGSEPVIIYDFTKVGMYAVKLRVSTPQRDADGYKTAADGVSVVRVRANPPISDVRFKINGREAEDIFNVTLKESQAGISFDPSQTTAAFGRRIEKYTWSFGDNTTETRNVPTTVVHTYNKTGEYNVRLEVTDNIGVKDKRVVKMFVKSVAADIIISPQSGDVNTTFSFQGIGSRSDEGIIRNYEWEIFDDNDRVIKTSSERAFLHKFNKPGMFKAVLMVTDVAGNKDKFTKTITINSRPPIANFTYSIPQKNHPNRVEFNAIDSYDPDEGDVIKYSWDFDGDGDFDVIGSRSALVTHEYRSAGEYRAKLQVEDAYGQYSLIEKKVSIDSILSADIISSKRATQVGEPIDFQADSKNAIAYLWEFGDGDTQSTEDAKVTHTYNKVGKFTVRLNFFDKDDNSNVATQTVLVGAGEKPVASIDFTVNGRLPNITEGLCGGEDGVAVSRADSIRFDAKNSINTDGSSRLLSYDWKMPGGERNSGKEMTFKFDEINREGECFSVSLAVRDQVAGALSDTDEVYFKVINELPVITDFVITPPVADELVTPVKIRLKVVNAKDNDGSVKRYRWWYYREGFPEMKFGVHNTSSPETDITITSFGEPDVVNRYYFNAEIIDNDNGVYDTSARFGDVSYLDIKNGPNLSPVADFIMDKTTISVGDSITFVSRSYDPQGDVLPNDGFRWDFDGDGEFDDITSGPQVSRQYNTPGEYNVRLRVVHRGLSSSASKTVYVEATDTLPQAAFTYRADDITVIFDAGNSRYDPSLTDTTLRYEWDFDINTDASGNGIKDDDVQSTDMITTYSYPSKGVYKVKLKVKDMLGMEGVVVRDVNLNLTDFERQKNAFYSIKINAPKNPITTLDIEVLPATLLEGESADVNARVLNADGSVYKGNVFFEVMDGSGRFTPNPVTAIDSKASSIFTSSGKGKIRIRVRATNTLYDELTEEAIINVK